MHAGNDAEGYARRIWQRIESLHAVTYFAPESIDAAKHAGLRGFWMGYVGFRASPLGAVPSGVVEATFANFAPSMVQRAIPDAWQYADPGDLVTIRSTAAAAALRRVAPTVESRAAGLVAVLDRVVAACDPTGRPLFAANRQVVAPADPVAALWQHCTSLREHRGDGHVAALVAAGIDGCAAHLLFVADREIEPGVHFDHRGWSADDQVDAANRLRSRGLLEADALRLTESGQALRDHVETLTDRWAMAPYRSALTGAERTELFAGLSPAAAEVASAGVLPFPNPMGLPALADG